MRYFYLYLLPASLCASLAARIAVRTTRSHPKFFNLFLQLCTRVVLACAQANLIFIVQEKWVCDDYMFSSHHNGTPTGCHRRCEHSLASMQVTEYSHRRFFFFHSHRHAAVRSIFLRVANVHPAQTHTYTPNLFDPINWRQVPSECGWRSEKTNVWRLSIMYVSLTLTTNAWGTQGEWVPWIIIVALCVGAQHVVSGLSIHKSWFLLTPFARCGLVRFTSTTFSCFKTNS